MTSSREENYIILLIMSGADPGFRRGGGGSYIQKGGFRTGISGADPNCGGFRSPKKKPVSAHECYNVGLNKIWNM